MSAAIETGLLVRHRSSREHDPREHHPEHPDTPERLIAIEAALAAEDWLGWQLRDAPPASYAELESVHDRPMINRIAELCAFGGGAIDADTFVSEASGRAAYHAAGGACEMVRALVGGETPLGFAMVRPSGHHAERSRSMGFCLFNNVAIAAQVAISALGVERVFIFDFDVHHGNGTAEIFRYRRDVLFASIHQSGIYPGTGALSDGGSGQGLGYTLNLPVTAGADGELWLSLLEHVIVPAAAEFAPELILISAGFDAHRADPLGGCRLETEHFAQMACHIRELARDAGAPLGAVLEGGYDLEALPACVIATMRALAGEGDAVSSAPEMLFTSRAAAHVGHFWEL
jgi:acetoin utilization deacetylase AcuC-like enzyme